MPLGSLGYSENCQILSSLLLKLSYILPLDHLHLGAHLLPTGRVKKFLKWFPWLRSRCLQTYQHSTTAASSTTDFAEASASACPASDEFTFTCLPGSPTHPLDLILHFSLVRMLFLARPFFLHYHSTSSHIHTTYAHFQHGAFPSIKNLSPSSISQVFAIFQDPD